MHSAVPLRDYLTDLMNERICALRELLLGKFDERDKARTLQADEYSRRLSELNHAHSLLLEHNALYVSSEKFESFQAEFRQYKSTTERALTLAAGASMGVGKMTAIIAGAASFIGAMIWIVYLTRQLAAAVPK
jgi:hypothetical protein